MQLGYKSVRLLQHQLSAVVFLYPETFNVLQDTVKKVMTGNPLDTDPHTDTGESISWSSIMTLNFLATLVGARHRELILMSRYIVGSAGRTSSSVLERVS